MTLTAPPAMANASLYAPAKFPVFGHVGAPARTVQPQFGNAAKAVSGLAGTILPVIKNNKNVKRMQGNGTIKKWVIGNVAILPVAFLLAFFNPQIAEKIQAGDNDNIALSSIPQERSNAELQQRVDLTLKTGSLIGDRDLIFDLAQLGYVREVIASGPNADEGKMVLHNGRTIAVPLDSYIRTRLREEHNIPIVHSLGYGIKLDPKVAAGVAAGISNVLVMAFLFLSFLIGKLRKPDEKKEELGDRYYTEQIGRFIVANELGVTRAPIGPGVITEEKDLFSDVDALTRDEVWNRMVVLPSGFIAEQNRYSNDVSAMSAKKPKQLLEVARVAVSEMGLSMDRTIDPVEIAQMTPAQQEELAQKLAKAAFAQAKDILSTYSTDQLDQLGEAMQLFKDLTKEEGRALIKGEKTLEQLKEERGFFNKNDAKVDTKG